MTTAGEIYQAMEAFAPSSLADSWDNVGFLVGDKTAIVKRVICALDATLDVIDEAIAEGAQLVVAHHPLIFTSMSRVVEDDITGRAVRRAIQNNISIICMHTNADCADGGVNDALAAKLGLSDVENLGASENGLLGRVGNLKTEFSSSEFAAFVKESLCAGGVRYCVGKHLIRRVAVGGGACGKFMDAAIRANAQAFVIGDCSYDIMQRAEALGLTLVDAGHFPTETPIAEVFTNKIRVQFPRVEAFVSKTHKDCIHFV